jgi:OFA family oxalate/formate antiporter-like MFS transporter
VKKYQVLLVAMLVNLLFGFQYTWAIFDRILINDYKLSSESTQFVFSSQIVAFAITFAFSGRLVSRFSPRVMTTVGALVYGSGLALAAWGGPNPTTLALGVGVSYGVGLALGYIGPLVTAVKWFPERKGIATGLVVAAFGSGTIFFAAAVKALIARGMSIFSIFFWVGIFCAALISILAVFLVEPASAPDEGERKAPLPPGLLRTKAFWALVVGFFAGTCAGLSIVGSLEKIGETAGAAEEYLKLCVIVLGTGNTIGRAGWGAISEIIGTRKAVSLLLVLQALFVTAMIFLGGYGPAFVVLAFLFGFNYGGNFVLYVAEIARTYGPERVGSVYSLVFLIYVVSGLVGPPASGMSYHRWSSYVPSMAFAVALMLVAAVGFLMLFPRKPVPPCNEAQA